jgi:hypothetical protein
MEFDHNPPLVKHYYEGPGGGKLPGYNLTQAERIAHARNIESGAASAARAQREQGAAMARYSMLMRRMHGLD